MSEVFMPIESAKKSIKKKSFINGVSVGIIIGGIIATAVGFLVYHPIVVSISIK